LKIGFSSRFTSSRQKRENKCQDFPKKAEISKFVELPQGKELEYRIVALNKAGEAEPSNTAMVVL